MNTCKKRLDLSWMVLLGPLSVGLLPRNLEVYGEGAQLLGNVYCEAVKRLANTQALKT